MPHSVEILDIEQVTHDVKKITVEKPFDYMFEPGYATEVAIQKKGWDHKKRPFTFTSIPSNQTLEFIIKIYDDHNGVTKKLNTLIRGDHLLIGDAWGTIEYKGPGIFIAGGAGITPFISIFRQLYADNKLSGNTLIFANKSEKDIILRRELEIMLGYRFRNVITESMHEIYVNPLLTYLKGYVNEEYLKRNIEHIQQKFYVCGPPLFNESILKNLQRFGANANSMVFEQ
jgi:ferredoxin-NADP reductase